MSLDKSIALFGATGLVGSECLRLLLDDGGFSRVVIFTRRPISVKPNGAADHPTLETHVLDFEQIERQGKMLAVDQIVCALGTTIRKAGSQQEFWKVDFDYPPRDRPHRSGAGRAPLPVGERVGRERRLAIVLQPCERRAGNSNPRSSIQKPYHCSAIAASREARGVPAWRENRRMARVPDAEEVQAGVCSGGRGGAGGFGEKRSSREADHRVG